MRFDKVINLVLEQIPKEEEKPEPQPWCLEIKKDLSKRDAYNELGDLIIKLFELRSRLE
jgi:hypothetical protein